MQLKPTAFEQADPSMSFHTRINSWLYKVDDVKKCDSIDQGYCEVEKKWCCLVPGCHKKVIVKEKPAPIAKSGEKYIYYNRAADKWHCQIELNGHRKSLGKSHDIQELVKIRDEYLKGVKK